MTREETTILVLALGSIMALIIWYRRPGDIINPVDYGPGVTNLVVNQPFMFSPPVANIIPNMAASQLGESIPEVDPYYSASNCGCKYNG